MQALEDGGEELDMVVNIPQVLSGNWDYVCADIRAVTDATHAAGQKIKVIFENCYLNDAQKIRLCQMCGDLGVDWVKTSTGYGSGGSSMEDLALMRKHSPAQATISKAKKRRSWVLDGRTSPVSRVPRTNLGWHVTS